MVLQSFPVNTKTSIILHTHLSHVGLKCVDKVENWLLRRWLN